MSTSATSNVNRILSALETLEQFSYSAYKQGIKELLGVDTTNWSTACTSQVYGEDPGGNKAVVNRFKVATIALGVSRTSGYSFSESVVQANLTPNIDKATASIVVPVYRQHLEDHIAKSGDKLSILTLVTDPDFAQAFITRVLDPDFINNSLIARYFQQAEYVQAIAYIYERTRDTLTTLPSEKVVYHAASGVSVASATIGLCSLPDIGIFASTVQATRNLNPAQKADFLKVTLPIEWSDNALLQGPSFPTLGAIWSTEWRADTYATDVAKSLINVQTTKSYYAGGRIGATLWVTYGDALWRWMENQQNNGFSDLFQMRGTENESYVSPFSGSCFTPSTLIATASGDCAISSLKANDKVLTKATANGEYGFLSDEKVVQDITPVGFLNKRAVLTLYGFNGKTPFVTDGHIFITVTGPRAINPEAARSENPRVHVGKLVAGDILLRLNKQRNGYDRFKIRSIESAAAPATTKTVHGLHFSKGGGGRYHANGFWVVENYPEITIQALQNRYKQLSPVDQHLFRKQVERLPDHFREVFGPTVHDVFKKSFSQPIPMPHKKAAVTVLEAIEQTSAAARHLSVKDISAHYILVHHTNLKKSKLSLNAISKDYESTIKTINQNYIFPDITLHHGAVLIDGKLAKYASTSHLSVQWSHEIPGKSGIFQHGVLRITAHGKAISGFLGTGSSESKSLDDLQNVQPFFAVASANDYSLTSSPGVYKTIRDAEAASPGASDITWNHFWKAEIGVVQQNGGLAVQLTLPDLDAAWNTLHPNSGLSLYTVQPAIFDSKNYTVQVPIQATTGYESYFQQLVDGWNNPAVKSGPAFYSTTIILDLMSNGVHGYYTELKQDGDSGDYKDGPIHAVYSPGSYSLQALHTSATSAVSDANLSKSPTSVHDPSSNIHLAALPGAQALSTKLFSAADLSIQDLQMMTVPSESDQNSLAQTYIQNAATYWRAQPEIDVFGDDRKAVQETIPDSLKQNLYKDGQTFLGGYSKSMIMTSLSGDAKFAAKFTDGEQDTINYYWQGGNTKCVSQSTDFNKITKIAAAASFLANTPGLNPYIQDTQDWAQLFYNFVASDAQLNNQAFAMILGGTNYNNLTNKYCMILNALDSQNRNFDVSLWNGVRDKILVRPSTGTITDPNNEFPEFATELARQVIIQVQAGTNNTFLSMLTDDITNLEEIFSETDAAKLAALVFSAQSELGRCFTLAFASIGKIAKGGLVTLPQVMQKFSDNVTRDYPNLVKAIPYVQGFVTLAVQGLNIYMSIKELMNWGNLEWPDKVNAIASIVNSVAILLKDCGDFLVKIKKFPPGSFEYQTACIGMQAEVGNPAPAVTQTEENSEGITNTTPLLDQSELEKVNPAAGTATLDEQIADVVKNPEITDNLAKTFSLSEAVVGIIGVVANIATAITIGFQIASDFETGQPAGIITLDILSEVMTTAQVITGGLEIGFAIAGAECTVIPFVGAVVALAGIVLMFVEMFVPHKPAEDPVSKYIDDAKAGYISSIPVKPLPQLTYAPTTTLHLNTSGTFALTITDPNKTGALVTSIIIRFTAGSDGNQLFAAPSGDDGKGNPTANVITYTWGAAQTDFNVTAGKFAGTSDNSITAKITSVDPKGHAIGPNGLTLNIAGNVNATAGTARVKVVEGIPARTDVAAGDVYEYFDVAKS